MIQRKINFLTELRTVMQNYEVAIDTSSYPGLVSFSFIGFSSCLILTKRTHVTSHDLDKLINQFALEQDAENQLKRISYIASAINHTFIPNPPVTWNPYNDSDITLRLISELGINVISENGSNAAYATGKFRDIIIESSVSHKGISKSQAVMTVVANVAEQIGINLIKERGIVVNEDVSSYKS